VGRLACGLVVACAATLAAAPIGASAGVIPSLTISNATVTEGDSGVVLAKFKVRLSSAASGRVRVHYSTADGTATSPNDYVGSSGTLSIPAGKVQKVIAITVAGDRSNETNETFKVTLSNPTGATIADRTGLGRIRDDDGVLNETDLADEADFCDIEFPLTTTASTGTPTEPVFGQILETGVTELAGPSSQVTAQLGLGPGSTDPRSDAGWTFQAASYNTQAGNNDEYAGSFLAPAPGTYAYAYRFSLDGGFDWTYCDDGPNAGGDGGSGSNPGLTFETNKLGVLTVTP
jgi:hypothetical protein